MIAPSLSSAGELLPQYLDWTLVFVSFLSRYPFDTENQIYLNSKTRTWNPILLVMILRTASFQICLWISPCIHQCFAHYHLIIPRKISNLSVYHWSHRPFCYLQNKEFEGSHKNGFQSLCSEYRHYRSDYLLSSIQQSWATYWLP